jgi:hypothetical protein
MHGNARRVRSRARHLRSRARIAKALRRIGIDAHSPRASGVGGAAGALDGELPVSAVGLVALGERGVSRAGVGCWCGMATALELASLIHRNAVTLTLPNATIQLASGRWGRRL